MKSIKLYNLIKEYELHDDGLIFIHYYQAEDFFRELNELANFTYDDEKALAAYLRKDYFCFDIKEICEDCELDWEYVKSTISQ